MRALNKVRILALAVSLIWFPTLASAVAPVAVFPLQELGEGRNDANLPFTRILTERLTESGNKVIGLDTVISFMANNRIRILGRLDTFNISRVRNELGAAFILLGVVSQRKERPEPTFALTLSLVRTSDARTVWSYVGSVSTGEDRRVLGIGEPQSTEELQPLLLKEIREQWPWRIINEVQQSGSINIESVLVEPRNVRPGDEVRCRVRLRRNWFVDHAPRIFFKADKQLYPAVLSGDGSTYEGSWIAGEDNGRFPVALVLQWPLYGRTESTLLGSYMVDGTKPLLEVELPGVKMLGGIPVFPQQLVIAPHLLVRKVLSRWRLAFYYESGNLAGDMNGEGSLPKHFIWSGNGNYGRLEDGVYKVEVEVWDLAGNSAKDSKIVELNRSLPKVDLAVDQNDEGMVVDLAVPEGKVPLSSWRMEMWTKEGKILTQSEGKELPAKIGIKLPDSVEGKKQEIRGVLVLEDILGNRVRQKVEDLLPKLEKKAKEKAKEKADEKKPEGISESWVDEF